MQTVTTHITSMLKGADLLFEETSKTRIYLYALQLTYILYKFLDHISWMAVQVRSHIHLSEPLHSMPVYRKTPSSVNLLYIFLTNETPAPLASLPYPLTGPA